MTTHHPLDGASRFSLLGLLADMNGLVHPMAFAGPTLTEEQRRLARGVDIAQNMVASAIDIAQREQDKVVAAGFELKRWANDQVVRVLRDDRELANLILGERVVDAMFGDGPVKVTMSSGEVSTVSAEHTSDGTK